MSIGYKIIDHMVSLFQVKYLWIFMDTMYKYNLKEEFDI
jgi:hypothetical protein